MTSMIGTLDIRQQIGNLLFFLLILVIVLDPTNTVLHLKDVFFVLLLGYSAIAYKPDMRYCIHILFAYTAVVASYFFAELQGNTMNMEECVSILKAFAPLFMLPWIRNYNVIKLAIIPTCLACIMIVVMYVVSANIEGAEYAIYLFAKAHGEMILVGDRYIMGIRFPSFYLKSFVDLMFTLFLVFYYLFNCKKLWLRVILLLGACLFTVAFFCSGTRSTMLLPLFMLCMVTYASVMKRRKIKYLVYPILFFAVIMFLALIVVLASERGEFSNDVKFAHLTSYMNLLSEHPLYFILGQGPSTLFYSDGFRRMTDLTEWTYIELFRVYGLFAFLILFVVLHPLYRLWRYLRCSSKVLGIWATYIAYIFIAGTNPLLLSSTGMIMILAIYSYTEDVERQYGEQIQRSRSVV